MGTKVTLKSVKHIEELSEETNCFSATVYADGKKLCTVENHGQGGPNTYTPAPGRTQADIDKVDASLKAEDTGEWATEDWEKKMYEDGYREGLDYAIGDVLAEHLTLKDIRKWCRGKVAALRSDGTVITWRVTWGPGVEKRLKGLGDAVLLNPLLATEQGKRRAIELVKRAGE